MDTMVGIEVAPGQWRPSGRSWLPQVPCDLNVKSEIRYSKYIYEMANIPVLLKYIRITGNIGMLRQRIHELLEIKANKTWRHMKNMVYFLVFLSVC